MFLGTEWLQKEAEWKPPPTLCAVIILLVNTKGSTDSDMAKKQQKWRSPKFYDPLFMYNNLMYFIVSVSLLLLVLCHLFWPLETDF